MIVINKFNQGTKWLLTSMVLAGCYMAAADAAVQNVTAVFRPDPANPLINRFINTTPESGVCPGHMPPKCKELGIFSIRTNDINFRSNKTILANHESERQGAMFKVPSSWRDFQVTHSETGEQQTVQMRIAGIGNRLDINSSAAPKTYAWGSAHSMWQLAPSPCLSTNFLAISYEAYFLWFWIVPEGAGSCSRRAVHDITTLFYGNFEYAYELKTPNPLSMSTGQYTGSIFYTLGPGMDFDFGDVMIPNDNLLTFNFTLDVQHTLKVEVPPGGNRVELVPQGGWQAWLNQGRKPTRLFRDQTFRVSSSSRFKMNLECQYSSGGNTCHLWEPRSGHSVPLNVSVTLPNGLTDATGQPVNRRPLLRDGSGTELFQPGSYIDRKPGTLHFEITREYVEEMLTGVGKTYSGNVTVVWDSEI
ncbi:hypothetical protein [Pseudomonas fluorescens]